MSAPVDVLAVMDSRVGRFDVRGNFTEDETLREARAAVEELVEAAKEYRDAEQSANSLGGDNYHIQRRYGDAIARLDAALAKFGGAA